MNNNHTDKLKHDLYAPYWAAALIIIGGIGVSTIWLRLGDFWNGYVLDMTAPAWNYILFRGLFTLQAENAWTRYFTPIRTVVIFLAVCFGIESLQYFNLYDSTFDPWDLLAYASVLILLFIVDILLNEREIN